MNDRAAQRRIPAPRDEPPSSLPPELVRFIEALAEADADADYAALAAERAADTPPA